MEVQLVWSLSLCLSVSDMSLSHMQLGHGSMTRSQGRALGTFQITISCNKAPHFREEGSSWATVSRGPASDHTHTRQKNCCPHGGGIDWVGCPFVQHGQLCERPRVGKRTDLQEHYQQVAVGWGPGLPSGHLHFGLPPQVCVSLTP